MSAPLFSVCAAALVAGAAIAAGSPVAKVAAGSSAVVNGAAFPYAYNWTKFPCAWFGANDTNWESDAQIEAIGKYSMAIFGWQHLDSVSKWVDVVYLQLQQAALVKAKHPDLPVYVYTSFGWAFGMNAGVYPIMNDPSYKDFFLASGNGYEFSQTNCQQGHTSPQATGGRCTGYFWNFGNASARDWYIEHLVQPLADAPMIDGVFYDAFNYGYDIGSDVRPWGKSVTNIPNCNATVYTGCEALVAGSLDVAKRITTILNKGNKVPMFANPGSFVKPTNQHVWLNESRLVDALEGTSWQLYYEGARGDTALATGELANMMEETRLGVPAGVHTYLKVNTTTNITEDQLPHVALFLLMRNDQWYYFGSTGWWDDSFTWNQLYDKASTCGMPKGPATVDKTGMIFTREYENCRPILTCANVTDPKTKKIGPICTGDIKWNTMGAIY